MKNICFMGLVMFPTSLFAGMQFSLSGSTSNSSVFLQSTKTVGGAVSISFDVFDHLQLGFSHQQSKSEEKGYTKVESASATEETYVYAETLTLTKANSLDLTIILYYGSVFTPYIKAGAVVKNYTVVYGIGTENEAKVTFTAPPSASGGLGLSIKMNEKFSLNLSYGVSTGYRQETPDSELKAVLDSNSSVGITYKI